MHAVRNGQLLTFRCPGTSSPAVCRIRFSIASLRCRLLSFCYITNDMESRSQWQCSAKHDGTTRAHPDNRKMKVKTFFLRFAWRATITTHLYTLPLAVAIPLQNTSHRCCYWFINILGAWYTCIKFKTKRQESMAYSEDDVRNAVEVCARIPGRDWWKCFLRRWPCLSERKPQH